MASLLYKVINPPVKALLRSPFHGLMSSNTLLLAFTGRRSGRALSTPISYHEKDGRYHCFTSKAFGWWRNLTSDRPVKVRVRGRWIEATPQLEWKNEDIMGVALREFLLAVPRDAAHSGVKLDARGVPSEEDIRRVVPGMVYLCFVPGSTRAEG